MCLSVNDQPVSQHSFPQGAEFLGHTLATLVPKGCQDFNPIEQEFFEPELGGQTSCGCGYATTRPGRPDPVAQIRQPMLGPKFIQADTANECPARRMEDPESETRAHHPIAFRIAEPIPGFPPWNSDDGTREAKPKPPVTIREPPRTRKEHRPYRIVGL